MADGHNQYPYMPGVAPLREAIAAKARELYGHAYDPETEITVTSGATEALMATVLAAVGSGDEVVVIEPCYDSYLPAIRLAGGTAVPVPLRAPTADDPYYRIDWQRVRDAITPKTRLLMLNFPHNPTGAVLDDGDLDALEAIVRDTGVLLLSDEVYEHIVFDGKPMPASRAVPCWPTMPSSSRPSARPITPPAGRSATAARRASSAPNCARCTSSWCSPCRHPCSTRWQNSCAIPSLTWTCRLLPGQARPPVRRPGQDALPPLPSPGTFFLLADYSDISKQAEADFARDLTVNHGVTVIPVSAFYRQPDAPESNHRIVRFCFAKKDATLDAALERLASV